MALPGGGYVGSAFTQTNLDKFIPELWTTEIIRARNSKLVMLDHVKRMPDSMLVGDIVHVPSVGRLAVNPKIAETPVSLQNGTPGEFTFSRDRYIESSFMLEDIAAIQSNYDARSIYTEEAGLALARDIDAWILSHRVVIKALGNVVTNAGNMSLGNILTAKLMLEKADVDISEARLIVSPAQYTSLLQIDQFINGFYTNVQPVVTGQVGTLFGIPVVVTNAIKKNATSGFKIGDADTAGATPGVAFWNTSTSAANFSRYYPDSTKTAPWTSSQKVGGQHTLTAPTSSSPGDTLAIGSYSAILCTPEWLAFWMGQEPKVESSREVLFQADAVVSTQYYGCKVYRPECAVIIETGEAG
ncbi:major capsid protein [Cyanophage BHS3]|nr:major capsid protein [Cyanophage BHS3]